MRTMINAANKTIGWDLFVKLTSGIAGHEASDYCKGVPTGFWNPGISRRSSLPGTNGHLLLHP